MAEFRKATGDLRSTFDEHMRDLEREAQLHDLKKQEEERARQEAQRWRTQMPDGSVMQPLASGPAEHLSLPGASGQTELPLGSPDEPMAAPPDTVPRGRANTDAGASNGADPAPIGTDAAPDGEADVEPRSATDGH